MIQRMKKSIAMVSLACGFGGCASTSTNKSIDSAGLTVCVNSQLMADIDVDITKKLSGTAKKAVLFGFYTLEEPDTFLDGAFGSGDGGLLGGLFAGDEGAIKSAAAYKAVNPSGRSSLADVLVAPQYTLKKLKRFLGLYKETTATVVGYPGQISAIKKAAIKKAGAASGAGSDK